MCHVHFHVHRHHIHQDTEIIEFTNTFVVWKYLEAVNDCRRTASCEWYFVADDSTEAYDRPFTVMLFMAIWKYMMSNRYKG
jgi:hypothetical protein